MRVQIKYGIKIDRAEFRYNHIAPPKRSCVWVDDEEGNYVVKKKAKLYPTRAEAEKGITEPGESVVKMFVYS